MTTVKLGNMVSVKGGKRLPKGVDLVVTPNSHPYIRVRDLSNKHTIELTNTFEYVDDETQSLIKNYTVATGDIIISIVGTIGLISFVGETLHGANLTENCVKLTEIHDIDPNYLYYYLISQCGQNEIRKGIVGAVQAKLPIKNILAINIQVPNLFVQKRIGEILSKLDAKIESNQKINDNLAA
jgi:type I restriction enzyme S subunit